MYERGLGGLVKDEREALRLYKLAADQGNDEAKRSVERLTVHDFFDDRSGESDHRHPITHPNPTQQRGIRKRAK
jgi:TPR repeat protein